MGDLNRSINIGLKGIGRELGIGNLQFYSARHSMATIAINKVGINKGNYIRQYPKSRGNKNVSFSVGY